MTKVPVVFNICCHRRRHATTTTTWLLDANTTQHVTYLPSKAARIAAMRFDSCLLGCCTALPSSAASPASSPTVSSLLSLFGTGPSPASFAIHNQFAAAGAAGSAAPCCLLSLPPAGGASVSWSCPSRRTTTSTPPHCRPCCHHQTPETLAQQRCQLMPVPPRRPRPPCRCLQLRQQVLRLLLRPVSYLQLAQLQQQIAGAGCLLLTAVDLAGQAAALSFTD